MGIIPILYPQFSNIDIPEESCIDDIIIYVYLSFGTSHEIHSSESTYIKPPMGTIPLEERLFLIPILAKSQSH